MLPRMYVFAGRPPVVVVVADYADAHGAHVPARRRIARRKGACRAALRQVPVRDDEEGGDAEAVALRSATESHFVIPSELD